MWWTPVQGTRQAYARLRATAAPTSRAPTSPGPLVYATPWIAAAPPLPASTFFNNGNNLRR